MTTNPPPDQLPTALPAAQTSEDAAKRSRNLGLAVVVSFVIVCIALTVIAQLAKREHYPSGYKPMAFEAAAQSLGIEPVAEWQPTEGDGFSVALPARLQVLDDAQFQMMVSGASGDVQGTIRVLAIDTQNTSFGRSVMISAIPTTQSMTASQFVSGTAGEFKKGGYTIKDVTSYRAGDRRMGRLIYEGTTLFGHKTGVQIATIHDNTIWVVTGTVQSWELDVWVPMFEAIATTLELN